MRGLIARLGLLLLLMAVPLASAKASGAVTPPLHSKFKLTDGWGVFEGELLTPEVASASLDDAAPVTVPHIWPEGSAEGPHGTFGQNTYVLPISLPAPGYDFGLRAGKLRSVYRLYAVVDGADGTKKIFDLGGNGQPGMVTESDAKGRLFYASLPFEAREFDLVVQVSNHIFRHAGFLWAPTIGPRKQMEAAQNARIAASFTFSGLLVAIGIVTMFLAIWHGSGRYYYIGGALLLVMVERLLLIDNYVWIILPQLTLDCALRAEYIGLFLMAPGYYWLVSELYPKETSKGLLTVCGAFCAISILVALFSSLPTMFKLRDPFIAFSAVIVVAVIVTFWKAKKRRRDGASWAIWGTVAAALGMAVDIYLYIPGPRTSVEAVPIAALVFTCVLLGLFTVRYRKEQEEKEFLAKCLERANVELKTHAEGLDVAQLEAAKALDMKNSFLANISREIQTPLRAIINFSDTLLNPSAADHDDAEREKYLRLIKDNGLNLSKLMQDIISVSDIETGRFEVAPQQTDSKSVIEAALGFVEPVAHEKHILIDVKCDSCDMFIDQRLMRQALIKILSNAVKFSPVNGVVTVRGSLAGGDFVFSVMDTGPGMETEQLPVAMSLFGRIGNAKEAEGGVGLGLPLVARFMELLGGDMQIDSIPDLGTTATLSFPIKPREAG